MLTPRNNEWVRFVTGLGACGVKQVFEELASSAKVEPSAVSTTFWGGLGFVFDFLNFDF